MPEANGWFYRLDGKDTGPVSPSTIRELATNGRFGANTPIRKGSDGKWVNASSVKGLSFEVNVQKVELADPVATSVPTANSNLISCVDCGENVSRRAAVCPKCGCPIANANPPPLPSRESDLSIGTKKRANISYVIIALVLPILSGVSLLFVTSVYLALSISVAMVVTTASLVSIDAKQLGNVDRCGKKRENAVLLFFGLCLMWIVVYPYAFFRRQRFATPNLGFVSVAVAVFSLAGPILGSLLIPVSLRVGLPTCTSSEVAELVEKVVRNTPVGAKLKSIDGYREINFDPKTAVRQGECVAHSSQGDIPVKFIVEWRDKNSGQFQVRVPPEQLPACNSPEVAKLLDQVVRSLIVDENVTLKSIEGIHELSFNDGTMTRLGECVVHLSSGDVPIKFVVEWQDRNKGLFQVRTLPMTE